MPKVKVSVKVHTSAIPDQEVDIPSSHEEYPSSDHNLIPSMQITSNQSSNVQYVHVIHRGTQNGLDN